MSTNRKPQNLIEAIRYFSDLDVCTEFVASLRWPDGPTCPRCGSHEYSYLTTRRIWKCKNKECRKQYSVKVGTIFEDSPLGLDKWLPAVWLAANSKNGISSHELGRSLGVTQKSAWFMLHRIRLAMQSGSIFKMDGEVEVDETYIGGLARNMHAARRKREVTGRGRMLNNKTAVFGARTRDGQVRAEIVPSTGGKVLKPKIAEWIAPNSTIYSDTHGGYYGLGRDYDHRTVDHAEQYVNGQVHTNGIENFWSLLKRGLRGTYVSVEPFHLFRYIDERLFTYNRRDLDDCGRFERVLGMATGRRLTWAEVTGGR
jgi:transposase-like protein